MNDDGTHSETDAAMSASPTEAPPAAPPRDTLTFTFQEPGSSIAKMDITGNILPIQMLAVAAWLDAYARFHMELGWMSNIQAQQQQAQQQQALLRKLALPGQRL